MRKEVGARRVIESCGVSLPTGNSEREESCTLRLEDNYNYDLQEEEVVLEPQFSCDGMLSNILTLSTAECSSSVQIPSLAPEIRSVSVT